MEKSSNSAAVDNNPPIIRFTILALVGLIALWILFVAARNWLAVYEVKGGQGAMHFVLIEASASERDYTKAASELCDGQEFCQVKFWNDASLIPESLPMTDAQVNGMVASYTRNNRTGHAEFDCQPFGAAGERCTGIE